MAKKKVDVEYTAEFATGYRYCRDAVSENLSDMAAAIEDHDPHGASLLKYISELINAYQPPT